MNCASTRVGECGQCTGGELAGGLYIVESVLSGCFVGEVKSVGKIIGWLCCICLFALRRWRKQQNSIRIKIDSPETPPRAPPTKAPVGAFLGAAGVDVAVAEDEVVEAIEPQPVGKY